MKATKHSQALTTPTDDSPAFKNMVDLLALYSEAQNRMDELQADANRGLLDLLDEHKPEYAMLQEKLTNTEAALEVIAQLHPEWFGDKKSIKTPYGTLKFHKGSKLKVENEELTIALIEKRALQVPTFKLEDYTRTTTAINLEALEGLDDADLALLRVTRVKNDNFSVAAAKVDMGKAVKETTEQAKAA